MVCNADAPVKKERKYFFGYHLVNGILFSMKWMEDGGIVVGGIPTVVGTKLEITEEEFAPGTLLADLEKEHPCDADIPLIILRDSDEPNST